MYHLKGLITRDHIFEPAYLYIFWLIVPDILKILYNQSHFRLTKYYELISSL